MAQLPPKIPLINTISPNWHGGGGGFGHHQKRPPPSPMPMPPSSFLNSNPPWVDEFLDFSSARRGSHRRSASDSVAFLELVPPPEHESHPRDLDRLGEDQLIMSMFSDVVVDDVQPPALSSTSTPTSDHNSVNDEEELEKVAATEEDQAQSEYCKTETPQPTEPVIVDPKRVKRILANRQSAQRSRVRKLQYISELERSVTTLQTEVSALSPRVAFLDHQRSVLTVGNGHLKQRIAALAQDKIFKDAHLEALKKEIDRLREVYHHQQSLNKNMASPDSDDARPIVTPTEKELLSS